MLADAEPALRHHTHSCILEDSILELLRGEQCSVMEDMVIAAPTICVVAEPFQIQSSAFSIAAQANRKSTLGGT